MTFDGDETRFFVDGELKDTIPLEGRPKSVPSKCYFQYKTKLLVTFSIIFYLNTVCKLVNKNSLSKIAVHGRPTSELT